VLVRGFVSRDLSNNALTGSIPDLSALTSLEYLYVPRTTII
jgi:hypothetical protein